MDIHTRRLLADVHTALQLPASTRPHSHVPPTLTDARADIWVESSLIELVVDIDDARDDNRVTVVFKPAAFDAQWFAWFLQTGESMHVLIRTPNGVSAAPVPFEANPCAYGVTMLLQQDDALVLQRLESALTAAGVSPALLFPSDKRRAPRVFVDVDAGDALTKRR